MSEENIYLESTEAAKRLTDDAEVLLEGFELTFEAMRSELLCLIQQLEQPIRQHRWDSVLGDDISGRLIAIAVHRVMKRYAEETHNKVPKLLFVAPVQGFSNSERRINMDRYLEKRAARLGKRTLIVTEFIATGDNATQVVKALPEPVNFDLASVAVSSSFASSVQPFNGLPDLFPSKEGKKRLYYSEVTENTPEFYFSMKNGLLGRSKDLVRPTSFRSNDYIPALTKEVRALAIKTADEIYDEVFHPAKEESGHVQAA